MSVMGSKKFIIYVYNFIFLYLQNKEQRSTNIIKVNVYILARHFQNIIHRVHSGSVVLENMCITYTIKFNIKLAGIVERPRNMSQVK